MSAAVSAAQPELCAADTTLGEAAYRGFFAARDSTDADMVKGWESLIQPRREWWEAAARAVIAAREGRLL